MSLAKESESVMTFPHAVVWIDHRKATIVGFSPDERQVTHVSAEHPQQIHRKSGPMGPGKAPDDRKLFDEVTAEIGDALEVLIVGPGTAKGAFMTHLKGHHPKVAARVLGVETLDHPSDGELLAFARTWFKRTDALR
jgi:stalled ribosome rescue protein Dom34